MKRNRSCKLIWRVSWAISVLRTSCSFFPSLDPFSLSLFKLSNREGDLFHFERAFKLSMPLFLTSPSPHYHTHLPISPLPPPFPRSPFLIYIVLKSSVVRNSLATMNGEPPSKPFSKQWRIPYLFSLSTSLSCLPFLAHLSLLPLPDASIFSFPSLPPPRCNLSTPHQRLFLSPPSPPPLPLPLRLPPPHPQDFKIISKQQKEEGACHKCVLCAHSPLLADVVSRNQNGEFFSSLTASGIEVLLSYLYFGAKCNGIRRFLSSSSSSHLFFHSSSLPPSLPPPIPPPPLPLSLPSPSHDQIPTLPPNCCPLAMSFICMD